MLNEQHYKKIIEFQYALSKQWLNDTHTETYAKKLLDLLDEHFDEKHSFHGYLGNLAAKSLSSNGTLHGITIQFLQPFMDKLWQSNAVNSDEKYFIFSQIENYKTTPLYKSILKPHKFKDFMIFYLRRSSGRYLSYVLLFSKDKLYTDTDTEIIDIVERDVLTHYENFLKVWNMKNDINMLKSCANYFPVGVMMVSNTNEITYTNPLAAEYLAEMGYTDARFFGTFYINDLYPHIQYDLTTFGKVKPIRIGQFRFTLQSTGNPGMNFDISGRPMLHDFNETSFFIKNDIHHSDMSMCIYIVKDEDYSATISRETFSDQGLTKRESQVAEYIVAGMSNNEIADTLNLSTNTVKIHISNIYNKVGVRSRTELIDYFYSKERNKNTP